MALETSWKSLPNVPRNEEPFSEGLFIALSDPQCDSGEEAF